MNKVTPSAKAGMNGEPNQNKHIYIDDFCDEA